MKDTLAIHEQENAIKITIRTETLKPIIIAIKSYDPNFNLDEFDKENGITIEVLQLLVEQYQDYLLSLINDNVPTHYYMDNETDADGLEQMELLDI